MESRQLIHAVICVDVGNSRTKVAVWEVGTEGWLSFQSVANPDQLLLSELPIADWHVVSVNQGRLEELCCWAARHRRGDQLRMLSRADFPLSLNVEHPDRVGVDRLAAAFGAVQMSARTEEPTIIINLGTAVTIDLLDRTRTFQGGVIYPGPFTCFQSLARATDQLPELFVDQVPKDGLGKNTEQAIACGIWQMQIGAIREVVSRYQRDWSGGQVPWRGEIFLTGGGAAPLHSVFGEAFRLVPDLVLQGVRAAVSRRRAK